MVFCSNCGGAVAPGVRFCAGCGTSVGPPVGAVPQQIQMGGGAAPKYGTPLGKNGMPQPVTLLPTQALELPGALNRCYLGLGWAAKGGRNLDLDASAAVFSQGACVDLVCFSQLRDSLGVKGQSTVVHTGDVLSGDLKSSPSPGRDLERIYFDLYKLPQHVTTITLIINVFTDGATFADLERATCRVVNADTEQELGRFEMQNLKGNGLVFGQLVRNADACPECHGKGCNFCKGKSQAKEWRYVALGMARQGRTASDIVSQLSAEAKVPAPGPQGYQGATKPPTKTVAHKPSASRVSPGMVAATGVGVAAGAAIFTAVALDQGMLGGEGGQISGAMADLSSIDMPDLPDPDIDLAPVGEALSGLGEMGGEVTRLAV
jgi:stress response protein SCP2